MGIFLDCKGTTRDTFKIKRSSISAAGLSVNRTITLPDGNVNFTGGSSGQVLVQGAGNSFAPGTMPTYTTNYATYTDTNGNWTAPVGVTRAKIYFYGKKMVTLDGGDAALALRSDGLLYCWGPNTNGMFGNNARTSVSSPVLGFLGNIYKTIGAGSATAYAIDYNNNAWASGQGNVGALGNGGTANVSTPVAVLGGNKFKHVAGGYLFAAAINLTNDLYMWGYNNNGQLGRNNITNYSSPVQIVGTLKFKKVVCNFSSTLGLTTSGQLYAWGMNDVGQVGDGTSGNSRSSPVAVLGGLTCIDIAGCSDSSTGKFFLALASNGDAYAWGDNTFGQLGDNSITNRSSPVQVVGGLKFKALGASTSTDSSYGLTQNGSMYAWGDNTVGQLGDGTLVRKSSPVAVIGGIKFKTIGAINRRIHAKSIDDKVYSWGTGASGRMGDGGISNRSSPTLVIGGHDWAHDLPIQEIFTLDVVAGTVYSITELAKYGQFNYDPYTYIVDKVIVEYVTSP